MFKRYNDVPSGTGQTESWEWTNMMIITTWQWSSQYVAFMDDTLSLLNEALRVDIPCPH